MKNNSKKNLIASILIKWIDNMDFLNNEGKASLLKFSVNELAKDTEPLSCSIDKTRLSDHLDTLNLDEENSMQTNWFWRRIVTYRFCCFSKE